MRVIRNAVAISDLHLGSHNCYLHRNYFGSNIIREKLMRLLDELGPRDELILNGDILDLSLAGWDEIVTEGREFFNLIAGVYTDFFP